MVGGALFGAQRRKGNCPPAGQAAPAQARAAGPLGRERNNHCSAASGEAS